VTTFPSANYLQDSARTETEVKAALEAWLATTKQLPGGSDITTLTIASGVVTPVTGMLQLETEGAAASDDLTNVIQTNLPPGWLLFLSTASSAHDVIIKHAAGGAGQIRTVNGADFTLLDNTMWILLRRNGTLWDEVSRSYGSQAAAHRAFYATPGFGPNTFTGRQEWAKGANIASAATLAPGIDGNYFHVTGSVTITAIATMAAGTRILLEFEASVTLTNNDTSFKLLNGSYTTKAGDVLEFVSEGLGNWRQASGPVSTSGSFLLDTVSINEDFQTVSAAISQNAINTFTYPWQFMGNNSGTVVRVTDVRGVFDALGAALGNSGIQMVTEGGSPALWFSTTLTPTIVFRAGRRGATGSGTETTTTRRIGLMDSMPSSGLPTNGIWVEFVAGNYFGRCRASGTSSAAIDLGVATADAVMDLFEIRVVTAGLVNFFCNRVFRGSITTNIPTAALGLVGYHEPNGVNATNAGFRIDCFGGAGVR